MKYGREEKKTVWLVPHHIKREGENAIIVWRCNWGEECESYCVYARKR
jgi:hypothetical protein